MIEMQLPDGVKLTPMMKQYLEWKERYPDCLLMFRMGDFFEMFFDDAEKASSILDIALTARDHERAIPMAGVPHFALDAYLGKLIKAGLRVAICDQITPPDGRNIVERKVIRVVTPGTYAPQENDHEALLAAFADHGESASIALLNSATGRFRAGTLAIDDAISAVVSFGPSEMIVVLGQEENVKRLFAERAPLLISDDAIISREKSVFSPIPASAWLCRRWGISSLRAMGIEDGDPCAGCAAAALRYLEETQFSASEHVSTIGPIYPGGHLVLDCTTQQNLELVGDGDLSLYSVLNRCKTPAGKRMLREWILAPSADIDEINSRLDRVNAIFDDPRTSSRLSEKLASIRDIERSLSRLALGSGNPKDLGAIRDSLEAIPGVIDIVNASGVDLLISIFDGVPDLSELTDLLVRAVADDPPRQLSLGGVIRSGFDPLLDEFRDAIEHASENLRSFEQRERERTGLKLRVGINKVFGHYIEVGKSYADRVPEDYIRRQTVANGERFVNEELKEIERRVYRAENDIAKQEEKIYAELVKKTVMRIADCQKITRSVAMLDVLRALAEVASDNRYTRPVVDDSRVFDVRGARHPVIEDRSRGAAFTPNDIALFPDDPALGSIAVITGPNMAGKSTYLRTCALIAIMAHIGSFVPADSARIGRIDRVFTRIGARDELARGRSTFMVEMVETANILRHVSGRSLVVLDEVGRGTSTYDGMSIAWAVLEFLCVNVMDHTKALFATHYHELTSISLPNMINLSMAVEETEDGIRFLHKVVKGPANRSYGVEVAKLAGVPTMVVKRSAELLEQLERDRDDQLTGMADMSKRYTQREFFFDADREGILEELAACDPDRMTPLEALEKLAKLRTKSRSVLGVSR